MNRTRAILRWACTGLLALVLSAWVVSYFVGVRCFVGKAHFGLERGRFESDRPMSYELHMAEAQRREELAAWGNRPLGPVAPPPRLAFTDPNWHVGRPMRLRWLGGGAWSAMLPCWAPAGACAALCGVLWHGVARRGRAGCCAACGYSREGLAESWRCPECGGSVR